MCLFVIFMYIKKRDSNRGGEGMEEEKFGCFVRCVTFFGIAEPIRTGIQRD